jgi:hypothetical protein
MDSSGSDRQHADSTTDGIVAEVVGPGGGDGLSRPVNRRCARRNPDGLPLPATRAHRQFGWRRSLTEAAMDVSLAGTRGGQGSRIESLKGLFVRTWRRLVRGWPRCTAPSGDASTTYCLAGREDTVIPKLQRPATETRLEIICADITLA